MLLLNLAIMFFLKLYVFPCSAWFSLLFSFSDICCMSFFPFVTSVAYFFILLFICFLSVVLFLLLFLLCYFYHIFYLFLIVAFHLVYCLLSYLVSLLLDYLICVYIFCVQIFSSISTTMFCTFVTSEYLYFLGAFSVI